MAYTSRGRLALALGVALLIGGCEDGTNPFARKEPDTEAAAIDGSGARSGGRTIEQDVEAPEVFSVSDEGLWDGRPSLGGVWVAHPTVTDPERVIVRNAANGKSVVGALFRRERDNPGPKLQVSSDAAEELGMLAGQPAALSVVALRREDIPVEAPVAASPDAGSLETGAVADTPDGVAIPAGTIGGSAGTIDQQPLEPLSAAAAAIDRAEGNSEAAPPPRPQVQPANAAQPSAATGLSRPYVQIGIFSVEANATRAADQLRAAGVVPSVKKEQSQGKTFWRVIVGPALTTGDRDAVVGKVKGLGYQDAYAVSN